MPAGATVIDIGAGSGRYRERAREEGLPGGGRRSVRADGRRSTRASIVFTQDLDDEPTFDVRGYDYLLLLDVIEHLKNPEQFLERMRAQFDYSPRTLILTTPNIAFVVQRRDAARSGSSTTARPASSIARTRVCSRSGRCGSCSSMPDSGSRRSAACRRRFRRCWATASLGQGGARGQPVADPRQQVAVLVSDLRDRRGTPDVDFILEDCQAARRGPPSGAKGRTRLGGRRSRSRSRIGRTLSRT